jgi:TetR/AcrR family transcriptional regulator
MQSGEQMKTRGIRSKGNGRMLEKRFTAAERRSQLLRIAKELFAECGFVSTTTKAIAEAAGVSEGVIFKHFSSKAELYASILDNKANEIGIAGWRTELDKLAESESDELLVLSVIKTILGTNREDPQFQILMLQAALGEHPMHKVTSQRLSPLYRFLCRYIKKRQKQGAFRKCDPRLAAHAIISLPSYYGLSKILLGVDLINLPEDRIASGLTQLILEGLYEPAGSPHKRQKTSKPKKRKGSL